jgi:glycosyltransferase involved in cell wall biosynthesis
MTKAGQRVLIACDCPKSLIDFRGKLIEQMAKQHQVYVFTPQITKQYMREQLTSMQVSIHENQLESSSVSIFSDLRYIFQLYKLIKQIKPDLFFPYTFKPVIYGTLVAKFFGVKKITPMLSGLGNNFTNSANMSFLGNITRMLLKFSLIKSRRVSVILQNNDDYQTLREHKILKDTHKAFVVNGSGVDLEHYVYNAPDIRNISFIMIARLINAKGIYEYYEAARLLKLKYPYVKFKLIGAYGVNVDTISDELYSKIKSGAVIEYLGEVDDVRPCITNSSVVVLPSYYGEGVPRCLLESMAMGRPIITCDSVGCRETVNSDSEINGFLIPVKNVPALAAKMEFYINNPEAVTDYGLNGLALANKKFNVHLINAKMLEIMQLS